MPAETVVDDLLDGEDYPDGEFINIKFNTFAKKIPILTRRIRTRRRNRGFALC